MNRAFGVEEYAPFMDGNLQGETLGVIAFTVTQVETLNGCSSSTLPQVTLTINDASGWSASELFNAPVPERSWFRTTASPRGRQAATGS